MVSLLAYLLQDDLEHGADRWCRLHCVAHGLEQVGGRTGLGRGRTPEQAVQPDAPLLKIDPLAEQDAVGPPVTGVVGVRWGPGPTEPGQLLCRTLLPAVRGSESMGWWCVEGPSWRGSGRGHDIRA